MNEKFLAINCSPHLGGSCDSLTRAAQEEGFTPVVLREHDIAPCNGCGACENAACPHEDAAARLLPRIRGSEKTVFITPLYFCNFPARAKALIDRAQAFWAKKEKCGAKLYLLAVGEQAEELNFESVRLTFRAFCLTMGAEFAGARYLPHVEKKEDLRCPAPPNKTISDAMFSGSGREFSLSDRRYAGTQ